MSSFDNCYHSQLLSSYYRYSSPRIAMLSSRVPTHLDRVPSVAPYSLRHLVEFFKRVKCKISQINVTHRLKSCLSTRRNCELSSRNAIVAARGASLTSANLPKSSPSCSVQTIPYSNARIEITTMHIRTFP